MSEWDASGRLPGRALDEVDGKLLEQINSPADLKKLPVRKLTQLAEELREKIIETVSRTGGHLASNLGVAELTIALHTVFDFTRDRLLWDVGHQCYAHKILTGRRERFGTLRQAGGISGFPCPDESEYDLFSTGHAGTAISIATGMAWADQAAGRVDRRIVVLVGDASIVNGVSLEGLNNAGLLKRQFLVILNDNSMAIDVTKGALAGLLDRIRLTQTYTGFKQSAETVLRHVPLGDDIAETLRNIKHGLHATVHGAPIFESVGFRYFGPVDGHDTKALLTILRGVSRIPEPVLLHVHTQKGRGCDYAVEDPCRFHSPSAHSVNKGVVEFPSRPHPTWTRVFSDALIALARRDQRVVAITAAMPQGTGLDRFREAFPRRCIDVGISESHAVAMAAGLAKTGLRPVVAIYSTFLQRAFDQVFEEIALQKLPLIFCVDRAGLVGSDGAVQHGFLDIAYLRGLPGMVLMSPADEVELRSALDLAISLDRPCAIRYPRDEVPQPLNGTDAPFVLGRGCLVRPGRDGAFLALGATVEHAVRAAETLADASGVEAAVYSARFAKPLDTALIVKLIGSGEPAHQLAGGPLLTVEDHAVAGGFGSAVMELAAQRSLDAGNVKLLGLPDRFIAHASRSQQLAEAGLDADGLARAMIQCLDRRAVPEPSHRKPATMNPARHLPDDLQAGPAGGRAAGRSRTR